MKKIILTLSILLSFSSLRAQDFHMSMYDAAPIFLNPAMTGLFDGKWRIHGQYRTQWKAVNYKPYNTALVSFDIPKNHWGFGVQVSNFRAGIGNYNELSALGSVAYSIPIDAQKRHNISFGLQGGISQKSIEYQLLTFNNQYTTDNGGGFNNDLPIVENFSGNSILRPVTNAGFLYYYAKQKSKLNPFIGVSAFNLVPAKESFFERDNILYTRFYAHLGVRINITETFYLLPKVLVMNQKNFNEQTEALDLGIYFKGSEFWLLGGIIYRNSDAFIASIGAKKSNFIAKVAYDFNTSSLSPVSSGRGGFEVSFTYMKPTSKPKFEKICPRL